MKKIIVLLIMGALSTSAYAEIGSSDPSKLFTFSEEGHSVRVINDNVFMGRMDYAYNNPTAIDNSGNFYFCTSEGNRQGNLWIINKIDEDSGGINEVCRLNLASNKNRYIRSINYSGSGKLYVWLAIEKTRSNEWKGALVEITVSE
ncbi:hypothetical protein ACFL1E_04350 [Candidatus Omnitrophota bacterium]